MYVNAKMLSVEVIPGMGGEEDKGEWWRGEVMHYIFDIL
jgi:hypothetical protein